VTALDRKLVRDLYRLRGQIAAVAIVVASGVGLLVMSISTIEALDRTAVAYYERYRFADVFASLKRAPDGLTRRIQEIPGVRTVETRIVDLANIGVAGFNEPITARLVSVPTRHEPALNVLAIRAGRTVRAEYPDEVVVNEPFATAHRLRPGDTVSAIINGRRRTLDIVGVALSPEYVYALGPGMLIPDDARFGIFWMGKDALAAAFDRDGAFNDVSLALLPGASAETVIDRLDGLLARYGSTGAIVRADQVSNWFLTNEIAQLRTLTGILPTIFIAVSAFLANMVVGRLIDTERSEIGLLKAFGYANHAIAWHYLKLVAAMTSLGIASGLAVGFALGRYTTAIYADFYHFPFLLYRPTPAAFAVAALVSLAATVAGSLFAVRRAVDLPPAEAMRPPAPPTFRADGLSGTTARAWLDQPTRMILRQIGRWPIRAGLTALGVALAIGIVISALQWWDATDELIESHYHLSQRQTMTVGLIEPRSSDALREIGRMPGVLAVEPQRGIAVRFRAGPNHHRGTILGIPASPHLNVPYDVSDGNGTTVRLPTDGLVMSTRLARKLGVNAGGSVTVEVLEGRRPVRVIPVVGMFETYIGTPAYMALGAVNRMMRDPPLLKSVHVLSDAAAEADLLGEFRRIPDIAAITLKRAAIEMFHETVGKTLLIYISFYVGFACALAGGVTYNSTRISLSERGRDLATLRVLGFTRGEISYILLGETVILTSIALPAGCLVGRVIVGMFAAGFDTELFRIPPVIETSSYGLAMAIGIAAAATSSALVRRRLDRLDLIAVLKTRE
jgi:putative ABC transport system permease protein